MNRFGKNSPRIRGLALEPLAQRIDRLALDSTIRLTGKSVPSRTWLFNRAKLNGITLRCCQLDDAIVLVRVK